MFTDHGSRAQVIGGKPDIYIIRSPRHVCFTKPQTDIFLFKFRLTERGDGYIITVNSKYTGLPTTGRLVHLYEEEENAEHWHIIKLSGGWKPGDNRATYRLVVSHLASAYEFIYNTISSIQSKKKDKEWCFYVPQISQSTGESRIREVSEPLLRGYRLLMNSRRRKILYGISL